MIMNARGLEFIRGLSTDNTNNSFVVVKSNFLFHSCEGTNFKYYTPLLVKETKAFNLVIAEVVKVSLTDKLIRYHVSGHRSDITLLI